MIIKDRKRAAGISALYGVALCGLIMGMAQPAQALPLQPGALVAGQESGAYQNMMMITAKNAGQQNLKAAQNFIDKMGARAIDFLADDSMDTKKKRGEFKKLLQDSFDMKTIGRFTLGRYWRVATPAEREEYQKLFENMIIDVYSARFSEYSGQDFETRTVRADGDKDAIVTSYIVQQNGPNVQIDWRVRQKEGQYRVVDVLVEGVSMSVTQRSDFSSVIQRGGGKVEVLLAHLRDKM